MLSRTKGGMTGGKLSSHESFPWRVHEAARANPPVTLQNGPPKLFVL